MKFFDDIFQSISGNAKTKVNDPFIGAFIGAWIFCNWSQLAILIWGNKAVTERINEFSDYLKDKDLFSYNSIVFIPLTVAIIFLFIFPWVSLFLKFIQNYANDRLHKQAIFIELNKVKRQEALNKQKLQANPEKRFLEQNIQLDIERRKEIIGYLKARTLKRKANAEEAEARAVEAKSLAKQAALEGEKQQQASKIERNRFNLTSARLQSAQAANRFPSAYSFMLAIENSLKEDGVVLSLSGLGEVVATVFGYKNFQSLLSDDDFNNEKLAQVVYIKYDREELAVNIEKIIDSEKSDNENLNSDLLFDHIISVFEDLEHKMVTEDQVEELSRSVAEDGKYELLNGEELSGPMAESDTSYDEVNINDLESIDFDDGFHVVFSGSAHGSHRREQGVPGRDIDFSIEIKNSALVGTRALGKFEVGKVTGSLADYFSDEDEEENKEH